jgi:hypothetical protein
LRSATGTTRDRRARNSLNLVEDKVMTQRQAETWAATRAKGRASYILLFGALCWGLPTAILWTVFMVAIQGWHSLPIHLPVALIAFPFAGYFWGAVTWWLAETAYRKTVSSPPTQ